MKKLTSIAAAVAMVAGVASMQSVAAEGDTAWVRLTVAESSGFGGANPVSNPDGSSGTSGDTNNPPPPGGYVGLTTGVADGIAYNQILNMDCGGQPTCMPMATGYWLHHSNTQKNKFACSGTDLYKSTNNDPAASSPSTADDKVPLKISAGAVITASKSTVTETGSVSGTAVINPTPVIESGDWEFYKSAWVNFDAADPTPTQWVGCKLTWNQNDSEKAVGTYGGFMRVYGMNGNSL